MSDQPTPLGDALGLLSCPNGACGHPAERHEPERYTDDGAPVRAICCTYGCECGVPPRVLAAEKRREFAEVMARSSLGCPNQVYEHGISAHGADDYESDGTPVHPVCGVPGCRCGHDALAP